MISATAKVEQPEKVEITISITMPLSEWATLLDHLGPVRGHAPYWQITKIVEQAITPIRKSVTERLEDLKP